MPKKTVPTPTDTGTGTIVGATPEELKQFEAEEAGKGKKETRARAMELLETLNVCERSEHKPSELSGGEKQRVAIARALINNPSVVLADEPSGNLDSHNARDLYKIIFDLRENFKQTFVIVTHNEEHARLTDRMFTISDGEIH